MTRNMHRILPTIALALLAALPAAAAAPAVTDADGRLALENDRIVVAFADGRPDPTILPAGANATLVAADAAAKDAVLPDGAFRYRFERLVEFRDVDGDGAPGANEIVAFMDLAGSDAWTRESSAADDAATLAFSLRAPVKVGGPLATTGLDFPDREAAVTLAFRLSGALREVELGNATVAVPATAVEQSFAVDAWPWVDAAAHRLALETSVAGDLGEPDVAPGVESATVSAGGVEVGALAWATLARGADGAGADVDVPVRATIAAAPRPEGAMPATNATALAFVYDAPGVATLAHAGTIGLLAAAGEAPEPASRLGERIASVPAAGGLFAALGLAGAALAVARRRA